MIHSSFTIGLANYAAMFAVNHPFVVLQGSECSLMAFMKVSDLMIALASVEETK